MKIRVYSDQGGLEWQQMSPNSLVYRQLGQPIQVLRAGVDQPGRGAEALRRCRLPGGHPEGYLEAMGNLYRDFAAAIRSGAAGSAPGVPGISAGLRGMAFIEAVAASRGSDAKWIELPNVG